MKWSRTMRQTVSVLIAVVLLAGLLSACTGNRIADTIGGRAESSQPGSSAQQDSATEDTSEDTSENTSGDMPEESAPVSDGGVEAEEPPREDLTLENAEVRLVYYEEGLLVLAYHGPDTDTGMHLCTKADGADLDTWITYEHPSDGWMMAVADDLAELPETYTPDDLALSVTDYADDQEPTRLFSDFGEPMSDDELRSIGLLFFNGYCSYPISSRPSYNSEMFELRFGVAFIKYPDMTLEDAGLAPENFEFFAGDGTPLENLFEGYTYEVTVSAWGSIEAVFYGDGSDNAEEKNNQMCDELFECEPYVLFTGSDGEVQKIPLLQGRDAKPDDDME